MRAAAVFPRRVLPMKDIINAAEPFEQRMRSISASFFLIFPPRYPSHIIFVEVGYPDSTEMIYEYSPLSTERSFGTAPNVLPSPSDTFEFAANDDNTKNGNRLGKMLSVNNRTPSRTPSEHFSGNASTEITMIKNTVLMMRSFDIILFVLFILHFISMKTNYHKNIWEMFLNYGTIPKDHSGENYVTETNKINSEYLFRTLRQT